MILLSGRVPTRVPESLRVTTAVPDPRVTTVVPAGVHVDTAVPNPHVSTRVPAAPHIPTRRPPTKERLVARGSTTVTGVARLHVRMAVEYAEQGVAISQAAQVGVTQKVGGTCEVSGTADVWTRYAVDATQTVSVAGQGTPRDRRTIDAAQDVAVSGDGGASHVTHSLDAAQSIDTDDTVDFRPVIPIAATGATATDGAGMLGLAGSVVVDATQSIYTTSTATARLRYSITADNSTGTTQTTTRDGITIPTVSTQAIETAGQATTRPRHTVTALGSGVTAGTSVVGVKVAALGSAATSGSASPRSRYSLSGINGVATSGAATATQRPRRTKMVKSGNQTITSTSPVLVTSWTSDATYPATVADNGTVVSGVGTATVTGRYQGNDYNGAGSVFLYVNGAQVAVATFGSGGNTATATWTGVLNSGDVVQLWARSTNTWSNPIVQGGTSFVEIVPA